MLIAFYEHLVGAGASQKSAAYLAVLVPLCTAFWVGVMAAKFDLVRWHVWSKHRFGSWVHRQELRRSFLVRCGVSAVVASATLLREAIAEYDRVYQSPSKEKWRTCHANALFEWINAEATKLGQVNVDSGVAVEDLRLAMETLRAVHGSVVTNESSVLTYLSTH